MYTSTIWSILAARLHRTLRGQDSEESVKCTQGWVGPTHISDPWAAANGREISVVTCYGLYRLTLNEHQQLLSVILVMGAGQSLPSQNQPPSRALHVLRVTPSSPASKTDIEPFFDFVVGFQGDALTNNLDATELEKIVETHEGKTLNLVVWNSKNHESRGTVVVPPIFVPSTHCLTPALVIAVLRVNHL